MREKTRLMRRVLNITETSLRQHSRKASRIGDVAGGYKKLGQIVNLSDGFPNLGIFVKKMKDSTGLSGTTRKRQTALQQTKNQLVPFGHENRLLYKR